MAAGREKRRRCAAGPGFHKKIALGFCNVRLAGGRFGNPGLKLAARLFDFFPQAVAVRTRPAGHFGAGHLISQAMSADGKRILVLREARARVF